MPQSFFYINFTQNVLQTIIERLEAGHGLLITAIGLLTVFTGLMILWGVTASFPRILKLLDKKSKSPTVVIPVVPESAEPSGVSSDEITAVIGIAIQLELEEEDFSVLTLKNTEQEMSPWVAASRPSTMRH